MSEEKVKQAVRPQAEGNFQEHGTFQFGWDALAAAGTSPEDVLERDYWAHVSAKLRANTKIFVMAEDRSWYGELLVWQTYTNGALVSFVSGPHHLNKAGLVREESEFEVFDGGLVKKWCVRRMKDGRAIIEGCESQGEADMKLRNWLKAQGQRRAA